MYNIYIYYVKGVSVLFFQIKIQNSLSEMIWSKYEAVLEHEWAPSFPSLFCHNLGERHPGNYLTFFPSRCRRYPSFFLQTRPFLFVVTRVCLVLFGLLPTLFYLRILQIFERGNEGLLALTDYYKLFLNYNVLKISFLYLFLSYKRPFLMQKYTLFPTEEKI